MFLSSVLGSAGAAAGAAGGGAGLLAGLGGLTDKISGISKFLGKTSEGMESVGSLAKVAGIPFPGGPPTGAELGSDAKAFMDKAYPGTNPWERLSGGGGGYSAAGAAKVSMRHQKEMQARELSTRERVARIQARATAAAAGVPHGSEAMTAAGEFATGRGAAKKFVSVLDLAKKKFPYETRLMDAQAENQLSSATERLNQALLTGAHATIELEAAKYAKRLIDLRIQGEIGKNIYTLGIETLRRTLLEQAPEVWKMLRERYQQLGKSSPTSIGPKTRALFDID